MARTSSACTSKMSSGGMLERPIRSVLKTEVGQPTVGSNPTPSAAYRGRRPAAQSMPRRMRDETAAEDARQVRVIAHGVAGMDRKPTPAALQVAAQCGALCVPHWHLRGVADEQVAGFDCCRIIVVREHVGADAAGRVKRV